MLLASGSHARFPGALASLRSGIRAQPQRDVGWLHGLPHDPDEIAAQGVEVRLVSELGREALQRLPRVVLAAVEASINERLDAAPQRVEQGGYRQGGGHHHELGFLAGQSAEEQLEHEDAAEVEAREHRGERSVDEGTVYDEVYVVEVVAQDRYAHRNRQAHDTGYYQYGADPVQPHYTHRFRDHVGEGGAGGQHRYCVSEQLDLLALYPVGAPQPYQQRCSCYEPQGIHYRLHRIDNVGRNLRSERMVYKVEPSGCLRPESHRDGTRYDHYSDTPHRGAPTG